jgi:hypothetical protein
MVSVKLPNIECYKTYLLLHHTKNQNNIDLPITLENKLFTKSNQIKFWG